MKKKNNNIIKFPSSTSKIERKVEAILFAASEPLDLETIEKRLQNTTNIKKTNHKFVGEFFNENPIFETLLVKENKRLEKS